MPRKARIDMPGGLHHLIFRGIERKKIFQDDVDRKNLLGRLDKALISSETSCYAWALMPNHVHLLLRTGKVPLATVMRRLLTGYAVTYNHRHRRHGQLFQNRYKSILCQEDPYLLELVRYIHLNPLRARIVPDLRALESYPYTGHSVILGNQKNSWQDTGFVLGYFDRKVFLARRRYRKYVEEGVAEGKRPDLVGGGLIRSLGGWREVKKLGRGGDRLKGDERILGDSDFVMEVLKVSEEEMERRYRLKVAGYDLEKLASHAAKLFGLKMEELLRPGRYEKVVAGRSLFCYWAVRDLGISATELAKRIGISQPAVSYSVQRGEKIARENALDLVPK